jgi:hypothetical protein
VYLYSKNSGGIDNANVGGFAGSSASFSDCYALGNVFADKSAGANSELFVGALVGALDAFAGQATVERCFAAGSVIVQRHTAGTTAAGGIVGYIPASAGFALKSSTALGASVTLTGPGTGTGTGTQYIGRAAGNPASSSITQTNYANNGMRLYQDLTYANSRPSEKTPTPTTVNSKHGADAHAGMFRNPAFWTTGIPGYSGLGFSATNWDFSLVGLKGYPRLKDSDGAIMGGQ